MSNIPETIVGSALGVLLAQSPALPRLLRNLRLVSKACCEVSDAARDEVQVWLPSCRSPGQCQRTQPTPRQDELQDSSADDQRELCTRGCGPCFCRHCYWRAALSSLQPRHLRRLQLEGLVLLLPAVGGAPAGAAIAGPSAASAGAASSELLATLLAAAPGLQELALLDVHLISGAPSKLSLSPVTGADAAGAEPCPVCLGKALQRLTGLRCLELSGLRAETALTALLVAISPAFPALAVPHPAAPEAPSPPRPYGTACEEAAPATAGAAAAAAQAAPLSALQRLVLDVEGHMDLDQLRRVMACGAMPGLQHLTLLHTQMQAPARLHTAVQHAAALGSFAASAASASAAAGTSSAPAPLKSVRLVLDLSAEALQPLVSSLPRGLDSLTLHPDSPDWLALPPDSFLGGMRWLWPALTSLPALLPALRELRLGGQLPTADHVLRCWAASAGDPASLATPMVTDPAFNAMVVVDGRLVDVAVAGGGGGGAGVGASAMARS
eukprot:XP_001703528.1 predicted protein [Chlamydomonas reinhardtii]